MYLIDIKGSFVLWVEYFHLVTFLFVCFPFMKLWVQEMGPNGEDSLNTPLLQHSKNVTDNLPQASARDGKNCRKVMFKVGGIRCASCAVSIESVLTDMEGIENVAVSPLQGQAVIMYRPELINVSVL